MCSIQKSESVKSIDTMMNVIFNGFAVGGNTAQLTPHCHKKSDIL